jgi:hypothetical protein
MLTLAIAMQLTFTQKLDVLEFCNPRRSTHSTDDLVLLLEERGFKISAQTLRRFYREEHTIRQFVSTHPLSADATRRSAVAHPLVERELYDWIKELESRNVRLTGLLIREKARLIAISQGLSPNEIIQFSDGWLTRFKQRWGLKHYTFHGEAASAPIETINDQRKLLNQLLARYPPEDRFNVDETGLNFCLSPSGGIATQALPGVKIDKTRLTYTLATSCAGEKLEPFVIGHAKRPRCFTHGPPSTYNFFYASNSNAWMTSVLWQE